jgi:hypothetical protein
MTTYAMVAVWRMDPALAQAQQQALDERVIPFARTQPGFVQGRWTRASDGVRHIAFLEFDSAVHADAFAAIVGSEQPTGERDAAGVSNESIDVVEVIGTA